MNVDTQSKEQLRDVVTADHVREMLKADRGPNAHLISWKIRDFTEDDHYLSTFVVSIDVKYSEEESEHLTCYALKLDLCYLSEIFEDLDQGNARAASMSNDVESDTDTVYFSLGSLDECQNTSPIDLITDVHVKAALHKDKGYGVRLISWDIPSLEGVNSKLSSHFTAVFLIFRERNSIQRTSYIVKYNPNSNKMKTDYLSGVLFSKEIKTFMRVMPELNSALQSVGIEPLSFPKCFYSFDKPGKEMLFFEDLRLRGFKKVDNWRGFDISHTTVILKELAKFHSASILLEKRHNEMAISLSMDETSIHSMGKLSKGHVGAMLNRGIDSTLNILNKNKDYSKATKWLTRNRSLLHNYLEGTLHNSSLFEVICHGSCWDHNMLFRYDDKETPQEAMLINLQWSRKASLVIDLSSFLLTSLDKSTKILGRERLLNIYFKALKEILETAHENMPFTEEDLIREYKCQLLFGMMFALIFIPNALQEEEGLLNTQNLPKKMMEGIQKIKEDDEKRVEEEHQEVEDEELGKKSIAIYQENLLHERMFALFDELDEEGMLNNDIISKILS